MPADRTQPPEGAKIGAVLVLLADTDNGPELILTRRRRDMRSHPGQVSFPGGRVDAGEGFEEAALREAQEEIGLDQDSVDVIGIGPTFYIPPSRFWVVPVAARWITEHELEPNPWEVDEILRVPLAQLLDRDVWRHVPLSLRGSTWAWQLGEDLLWGATAMVTSLLLDTVVPDWSEGLRPEDLGDELAERPWEAMPGVRRRPRIEASLPKVRQDSLPHVTVEQMRAVDDAMFDRGLALSSMVEQAAHGLVRATRLFVDQPLSEIRATVAVGSGGNGAGGWTAARLLVAAGASVQVLEVGSPRLPWQAALVTDDIDHVVVEEASDLEGIEPGDVVLDAMLGIGAEPPLRDRPQLVADWIMARNVRVVSLDLPSGLSGEIGLKGQCIAADVTVTLGLPKAGILHAITHAFVGDLYVADLGIPPSAWRTLGVEPPADLFAHGPLVRLTDDTESVSGSGDRLRPDAGGASTVGAAPTSPGSDSE